MASKVGHLIKLGGAISGYKDRQQRWFELHGSEFRYFKVKGDTVPAGTMLLTGADVRVTEAPGDATGFLISGPHIKNNKTYTLHAKDDTEREEWVKALKMVTPTGGVKDQTKEKAASLEEKGNQDRLESEAKKEPPATTQESEAKKGPPKAARSGGFDPVEFEKRVQAKQDALKAARSKESGSEDKKDAAKKKESGSEDEIQDPSSVTEPTARDKREERRKERERAAELRKKGIFKEKDNSSDAIEHRRERDLNASTKQQVQSMSSKQKKKAIHDAGLSYYDIPDHDLSGGCVELTERANEAVEKLKKSGKGFESGLHLNLDNTANRYN